MPEVAISTDKARFLNLLLFIPTCFLFPPQSIEKCQSIEFHLSRRGISLISKNYFPTFEARSGLAKLGKITSGIDTS